MAFILSSNMNLPIPGVGTEAGPQYAFDVNNSLTLIDQHDHSPGRGVQITPAGININADLPFNGNNLTLVSDVVFQAQASSSLLQAIYVAPGSETPAIQDLWYNDSNGTPVQLTSNGLVNATVASIPGESYAGGTFFWKQTQSGLPTTPANFDIGSITLRPNVALTTFGVVLNPPSAIASEYDINLPLLPSVPSFLQIDNAGNITATQPVAPLTPDNAGAQGYFLRQNASSGFTWQTLDSTIAVVTTTYTIRPIDDVVQVSGSTFTATLPTAVGRAGKEYTVSKTDASLTNIITLKGNGSETIGSFGNTVTLNTQNESWIIYSDNVNWQVKSHTTSSPEMFDTPIFSTGAVGAAISFTSLFSAGASTITVSSATGLRIGMYLADITTSANLSPDTYITSISGTSVGLSNPTAGNSAGGGGDVIHTIVSQWKGYREGRFLVANFKIDQTNAGTAGTGNYKLTMPFGLTMDNSQAIYQGVQPYDGQSVGNMFGNVTIDIATGQFMLIGNFSAFDSTHIRISGLQYDINGPSIALDFMVFWDGSGTNVGLSNTTVKAMGWFKVPIKGWYP